MQPQPAQSNCPLNILQPRPNINVTLMLYKHISYTNKQGSTIFEFSNREQMHLSHTNIT